METGSKGHQQSPAVIAKSEAPEQSISPAGTMDCFAALAMTELFGWRSSWSMALEIIERLAAALAAPQRLAGGRAELGQELGVLGTAVRTRDGLLAEQRTAGTAR